MKIRLLVSEIIEICPHTKEVGTREPEILAIQPNNVSFVWGNLSRREVSCNNRLYFHSSFILCFKELFIYVTDFILLATLKVFSASELLYHLQKFTAFKWRNQDSLPGTQTPTHTQSPYFLLNHCQRYSIVCFCQCFCLRRQVMGGTEGSKVWKKNYLLPLCQPRNQA